jgi:hypothetical protein
MSSATESVAGKGPHRGGPTDPSHDENLRRGILHTDVSRRVAGALALIFLAILYVVPIGQAIRDKAAGEDSVLLELFRRAPTRENLRQFEDELQDASSLRAWVRPRLQVLLTGYGGYGNGKAVVGKQGWLFYAPGVVSVGAPGFLDAGIIAARQKDALDAGEPALHADPRPAILEFARFLGTRGIRLVVFPVPDKASLQPLELHGRRRDADTAPARNPDADKLRTTLERAGVLVFDPTPPLLRSNEAPRFLVQDTHWTPAWMESVAGQLAATLTARGLVPQSPADAPRRFHPVMTKVSRQGDIADMLGLPEGQRLFAPLDEVVHEVHDSADARFEPNEKATVLLLGDSFTNIFSLEQMGWGASAGLAPHLALALNRDVDVIARNDAGAHATRQMLFNALAGGEDRLAGKTVVIWELASRELVVGDFRPLDWASLTIPSPTPPPATEGTRPAVPSAGGEGAP